MLEVGQRIPNGRYALLFNLKDGASTPNDPLDLCRSQKVVVFSVMPFAPGATDVVRGYFDNLAALQDKGITQFLCVGLVDPYIMDAWSKTLGFDTTAFTFLADTLGTFHHACGLTSFKANLGERPYAYVIVVNDMTITHVRIDRSATATPAAVTPATAVALLQTLNGV
jgi:peroxiredoxin